MSTKKKTKKKTAKPMNKKPAPQQTEAKVEKKNRQVPPAKTQSAKPVKKKADAAEKKWVRPALWVIIVVLALILAFALLLWWGLANTVGMEDPVVPTTGPSQQETAATTPTEQDPMQQVIIEEVEDIRINLGYGLEITDVGKYAGVYMEDGTDEFVTDVLMIVVANNGDQNVQYAEITMGAGDEEAFFTLSTLPAGESVVLLEKNRMAWSKDEVYEFAVMENVAVFTEELSLCEDQLKLQTLDGAINVTNISGQDITGDIVIYYKNAAADLYYGGITYRVRIAGGMAVDEIKQLMVNHFSSSGSQIMFVTIG